MEQALAPNQDVAAERLRLERTWAVPRGIIGWLSAADHKTIGTRFIATAFAFFVLGGILAVLMRIQLARPDNTFVDPDLYNQLFSLHGTTMMFLFAVPVMEAMAIYLVPLMIGTREIAFPRLVAFNYWVLLFGGAMIYIALFLNIAPDAGWFSYVPLAGPEYSPGKRSDFWVQMVTFTELSALGISVQLIVTIFKQRPPGMSLNRMPPLVWAILVTSFIGPAVQMSLSGADREALVHHHAERKLVDQSAVDVRHGEDAGRAAGGRSDSIITACLARSYIESRIAVACASIPMGRCISPAPCRR